MSPPSTNILSANTRLLFDEAGRCRSDRLLTLFPKCVGNNSVRFGLEETGWKTRSTSGFSLLELMIVVTVIAILAGLTLAAMSGVNQRAARDRTKGEIAAIVNALESYKMQHGVYPTNMGTNVIYTNISGYLGSAKFDTNAGLIMDPYGKEYVYRKPGTANMKNPASFDILSMGADGKTDTSTTTNDDIGNW